MDELQRPYLEGHVAFENVESKFHFTRCIRWGSVEAHNVVARSGEADVMGYGERLEEKADGNPFWQL